MACEISCSQHSGHLFRLVGLLNQAGVDHDNAARQSKGVDLLGTHHMHFIIQSLQGRMRGQSVNDLFHRADDDRVVNLFSAQVHSGECVPPNLLIDADWQGIHSSGTGELDAVVQASQAHHQTHHADQHKVAAAAFVRFDLVFAGLKLIVQQASGRKRQSGRELFVFGEDSQAAVFVAAEDHFVVEAPHFDIAVRIPQCETLTVFGGGFDGIVCQLNVGSRSTTFDRGTKDAAAEIGFVHFWSQERTRFS